MGQHYAIVVALTPSDLEWYVNRRLEIGWKIVGGVSVDGKFYQAMIKDDEVVE